MPFVSSQRAVRLLDNRRPDRPFLSAVIYRGYLANEIVEIETNWASAREEAVARSQGAGLTALEHGHWDWRNKADSVEAGRHMLVAVEAEQEIQGLMAVLRIPRPARLSAGHVVYVDYVESAPWNLKLFESSPRFLGIGTILIAEAVRISLEEGFEGRVGLHSLPQAEPFYEKCRMTRLGEDPGYYDLAYFEHSGLSATDWLASIGELP